MQQKVVQVTGVKEVLVKSKLRSIEYRVTNMLYASSIQSASYKQSSKQIHNIDLHLFGGQIGTKEPRIIP